MVISMKPSAVRIIDLPLSTIAQGYSNQEFVGSSLFPIVPVTQNGGQIVEFGTEHFRLYNSKNTPGGNTQRVRFGYLGKPYSLFSDEIEVPVPRRSQRDALVTPGIDLGRRATNVGMSIITLSLEYEQAQVSTNAANYTGGVNYLDTNASKWSTKVGGVSTVDPISQIKLGREAIRAATGRYPNTIVFSATNFLAFTENTFVLDRVKYSERAVITTDIVAGLLNIPNVKVGGAIYKLDDGTSIDIWGNNTVMAFTELGTPEMEMPSYGYTYTMQGHPLVEEPYYERPAKSWIYGVTMERSPVLSGIAAGYLIKNAA